MNIRDLMTVLVVPAMMMSASASSYDPLAVADAKITSETREIKDAARDRVIPIRIYLPSDRKRPAPVILFSHGLGGSRDNNPYLGNHWAKRGYVAVFVQHPGSDEDVWKKAGPGERMGNVTRAASFKNLDLRGKDIPCVLDVLTKWNAEKKHGLYGRMDLKHVGVSGHSFGAHTAQAVAGQEFAGGRFSYKDPRVSAAVMMSPAPPVSGEPAKAFGAIRIPCLLMTGTLDDSPVGNISAADRLKVFPNLTAAPAWQVVFDKATHMSFGSRVRGGESTRYHRGILALTTAFWDANLRGDATAKGWLNGGKVRSVLLPADRWEKNKWAD